jgi:hypothetical protein
LFVPIGFFYTGFHLAELCQYVSFAQPPCRKPPSTTLPAKLPRLRVSRNCWVFFFV